MDIKPGVSIPDDELSFSAARSGGPGGQNVNKVSSKVVLRWNLEESEAFSEVQKDRLRRKIPKRYQTTKGEVVIHSSESRDQPKNREACKEKLASVLREALRRPKTRRPTKPTRGSKERRLKSKQHQKAKKEGRRKGNFD